jgi:two-component SAPR family response regulator
MKMITRFILVDDDPISNMLNEYAIKKINPNATIYSFSDPKEGLDFVLSDFENQVTEKTVLFLDVNMPEITGWDFISKIEDANMIAKNQLIVFILSSSVNPVDSEKAKRHPLIADFIEKPISEAYLSKVMAI